jgi:hypothetical protein
MGCTCVFPPPPSGLQAPYLKALQLRCLPAAVTTPAQSLLHAAAACWQRSGRSAGALGIPTSTGGNLKSDVETLEAAVAAHLVGVCGGGVGPRGGGE